MATAMASPELPFTMSFYKAIGHLFSYSGRSLALQPANNGAYQIGNRLFVWGHRLG